ncbi:hypothetical protein FRB99_003301 [Tulasnella sp. 403]|nr:hypothetical protein FRB99_003301 [Tulasnella sp. 403]
MKRQGTDAAIKVALKGLRLTESQEERERFFHNIEDTVADWIDLRHPNILPFLGFMIDPLGDPNVLLVSPFAAGGNLSDYLKRSSLSYEAKIELAKGIAAGLLYFHTRDPPVYHGNLHSRNVLVTDKGVAVLTDCGIAGMMEKTGIKIESPGDVEMSSRYWSPDVKAGAKRSAEDDVWSWGCILLEIMTGRVPYDGVEDVPAVVDVLSCSARIQNLLGLCWKKDRRLRPEISEITAVLDGKSFRFENIYHFQRPLGQRCFTATRDGTTLAIGHPNRVEIHDINERKRLPDLSMSDNYGRPRCLKYSRSGKYLVAGTSTSHIVELQVWDVETGRISRTISVPLTQSTLDAPRTSVRGVEVSWDDTLVASVLDSGDIQLDYLGDVKDGRRLAPIRPAEVVAFSPKSDVVAVGLESGGVQIFSVDTGESLGMIDGSGSAVFLSFSSDGRWLLEAGWQGIRKWDAKESIKRTPKTIYDDLIGAASILSDDGDLLIFTDNLCRVYVRMNCFDDSAVNCHIGSPSRGKSIGF